MRIVFMGTPDYSVKTLESLYDAGHDIVGVFAQPDKPVGRKHIITPPAVKVCAKGLNIPVFQPNTLRDGEALKILQTLAPELIVVVAYGKILPLEILEFAKYGCINGHASLLPKYRGASPIQWCIVCGETKTGVTIQKMDEGVDTGEIISTSEVEIGENETAEQLFERLSCITAKLMVETVDSILNGTATFTKQNEADASYAPILKKEMAELDFNKSAQEVHNAIRGFYSWPCAYFYLFGKRVKVIESRLADKTQEKAGTVIENDKKLVVACGDNNAVELTVLQPEGSKPMSAAQMLMGWNIPIGTVIKS